jgi:hypothetical protein
MRINDLRGTVADRPIDSRVVQEPPYPGSDMQRIQAVYPEVQQVDASRLARYTKG